MKGRLLAAGVLVLMVAASPLFADEDYRYGRIRYAEAGVSIQRGSESSAEEAEDNVPFLPGDRVWTSGGRAEFQFSDGSLLRLDGRSKLEYLSAEDSGPSVLRLHAGSLILHVWAADPGFEIETPGGVVSAVDRGVYRIDADGDEVHVSVYEGQATLLAGRRRVQVEQGESCYARRGEEPDDPRSDDRDRDEFARWDEEREGRASWASERRQYIPDEIAPYAGELESHGSWYFQADVGHVWRPYVASGWRPYCDGRWVWTAYGWTWIPREPWGWAPFHYGRWDYASNLGWYWIPGRSWGPAWVHWAVGTNYVGWCPRGYRDRIVPYHDRGYRGNAVERGGSGAWVYSQRNQLNVGFNARRRVEAAVALRDVRVIDAPHARPGRDLRSIETGGGRPSFRAVRTKPTIGDTVPELRSDNSTTIPAPVARRRSSSSPRFDRGPTPATGGSVRPGAARPRSKEPDFSGVDPELRGRARGVDRPAVRSGSSFDSRPRGEARPRSGEARPRSGEAPEARPRAEDRAQGRGRASDPDRDVMRRMFRPLTETRRERDVQSSPREPSRPSRERSYESRPSPREQSRPSRERSYESRPRPSESRPSRERSYESRPSPREQSRPSGGDRGASRQEARPRSESRPAPPPRASRPAEQPRRPPKERH